MVAPTMTMLLVKTKRREQAPALRYEIDFSAKVAEMRESLFVFSQLNILQLLPKEKAVRDAAYSQNVVDFLYINRYNKRRYA